MFSGGWGGQIEATFAWGHPSPKLCDVTCVSRFSKWDINCTCIILKELYGGNDISR